MSATTKDGDMTALAPREFTLDDRYEEAPGEVILTGLQALVRVPFEQRRRDARRGAWGPRACR